MARTRLGRIPGFRPLGSWLQWYAFHPDVRKLVRKGDTDGLLRRFDTAVRQPQDADDPLKEVVDPRSCIISALGAVQAQEAVPRIAPLLSSMQPVQLRMCAAKALERIGGEQAATALVPALEDEQWFVKNCALKGLEANPIPDVLPVLAALATSEAISGGGKARALLRMNALGALGRGKQDQWIPVLETGSRDKSFLVYLGASSGLMDTESLAALDALRRLARERRGFVRGLLTRQAARKVRRRLRRAAREA
jgi:HEAT repeat protein